MVLCFKIFHLKNAINWIKTRFIAKKKDPSVFEFFLMNSFCFF